MESKTINTKKFQTGDRVKNLYGRLLTVLVHKENSVYVKEDFMRYDPQHLIIIKTCH